MQHSHKRWFWMWQLFAKRIDFLICCNINCSLLGCNETCAFIDSDILLDLFGIKLWHYPDSALHDIHTVKKLCNIMTCYDILHTCLCIKYLETEDYHYKIMDMPKDQYLFACIDLFLKLNFIDDNCSCCFAC